MSAQCLLLTEETATRPAELIGCKPLEHRVVGEGTDAETMVRCIRERRPDCIIVEVEPGSPRAFEAARILCTERVAAVLVVSERWDAELARAALEAGAVAFVPRPRDYEELRPIVEIAVARQQKQLTLERELDEHRQWRRARIAVERAKGVLMECNSGMTEARAYRVLQKISLDTRKAMEQVAQVTHFVYRRLGSVDEASIRYAIELMEGDQAAHAGS